MRGDFFFLIRHLSISIQVIDIEQFASGSFRLTLYIIALHYGTGCTFRGRGQTRLYDTIVLFQAIQHLRLPRQLSEAIFRVTNVELASHAHSPAILYRCSALKYPCSSKEISPALYSLTTRNTQSASSSNPPDVETISSRK